MARHPSGVFVRSDRVRAAHGTVVRVTSGERKPSFKALLVALGTEDLVLTCAQPLRLGTRVAVAITLPGRYIEFEVPGDVEWENGASFGVRFDYLTARQAYGITLARELLRAPQKPTTLARPAKIVTPSRS
jgi:hypothetical protein